MLPEENDFSTKGLSPSFLTEGFERFEHGTDLSLLERFRCVLSQRERFRWDQEVQASAMFVRCWMACAQS